MNKLAEFPLQQAGYADSPDDTVIVSWPGWNLTVGDVRKAQADAAKEPKAFARRWYINDEPVEKKPNVRGILVWPAKFKLSPVSARQVLEDDEPLYMRGGE